MKYKAILLDIDNTLYDYNRSHVLARKNALDFCESKLDIERSVIDKAYDKARKKIHIALAGTASSHNRFLYFQKMLEILKVNPLRFECSLKIYDIYWDTFLNTIEPFDGIYPLLEKYRNNICLITDLTAYIQYRKIKKLGLSEYVAHIVTSEEVGREKPHPYIFLSALQKLDLKPQSVCMIGDNFKRDILGANSLGIKSIWLNKKREKNDFDGSMISEVKNFNQIMNLT